MPLRNQPLLDDVNACRVPRGALAFWWLGQHSFILKLGKTVLYIDPFLTALDRRQVPPLLKSEEITNADLVLGSHDHADHIDRAVWPVLAAASPRARFVVPKLLLAGLAKDLKIPKARFIGLDDGTRAESADVCITGIAAAHEFLDRDPRTGAYPYLGYVVEGNGCTVYHSGDSCVYEGLQTKLKQWSFDLAFLPINGRDAKRLAAGCIGNMTYQEAADLAGALAPRLTVPTHYDMFAMNSENPALFTDYMRVKYPKLATRVCEHGQRAELSAVRARAKRA
ncbi:MAG: MBL fold metallo-hydrolase [Lentisphaerae bacterium RIFOXYB12_FULL_65_16]|nr:MAG: MBL fold metallo-hydrolase [Lentisphaerae bacterium RIFOXYA12_64_32]OGV91765.1 MAG: MBL fold metallo-hydrolase [Lentisphaerae bacterium RIFOXYB12_FULL_65_16]